MPAPDFRLYHGNDLDLLAGQLANELAAPAAGGGGLAPDTILIPQPAMRRWLQKTLAETHGVAANLRFLTPGEFVREALAANLPGDDDPAVADAARLRWRLWAQLADPAAITAPVFAPLQPVLAGPDRALAAWDLAGELAQAFEKYQAWRRDWLLRWDDGADPQDWQAELWRLATRGRPHRARRLHAYLQRFGGEAPAAPVGLPARLFAFACQNVSPDVLRVIASAALAGPLHFYFVSPAEGWWGDLATARERLRADARGVFAGDDDAPLLVANGAAGRDFVNLLFTGEAVVPRGEVASYFAPPGRGLLPTLQRDLLARRPPPAAPAAVFEPDDRSLQVHACHTPLREVQVLHDQLRRLLEADPALQPRDIAVLTPDIDAYAPLVHAVFGGAADGAHAIPYALADGSALASQPLADWFLRLLALAGSRFTLAEGLDLLAPPAVCQRLGLPAAARERLGEALRAAGARWARDGAQRAAAGAGDAAAYTWQWALDRLLLGHATGDAAPLAGVAPLPVLDGGDLDALDALLAGLRAFDDLARALAAPQAPAAWSRALAVALERLLPDHAADAGDRRTIEHLRESLGALAREWADAGVDAPLPASVLRAWFQERLGADDGRQPFLSGGVTFGRMVPMRLIPFKVICLLGMNDRDYPRRDPGGALNRLADELGGPRRRTGDRSVREDDRYLFLQLLAAAGQVFYVSYLGNDPRSGEPMPPSVVVSELVELAARYRSAPAGGEPVPKRLVLRHPLQPFSPAAFGAPIRDGEAPVDAARRRSFHAAWHPAAQAGGGERGALPPFVAAVLPPRAGETGADLSRDALFGALANPARHFLRQRLDLRLPQPDDPYPDAEPFDSQSGLARYVLGQRVFEALCAGMADDGALAGRLLAEAMVAPGPAGREAVRAARALVGGCARQALAWAGAAEPSREFRIALEGGDLVGRFDGVHANGLLQFRPGREHGRVVLGLGLDWLAWHASGETRPVRRLLPGLPARDLPVLAPDEARARLQALVALAVTAQAQALPFLPKAGYDWFLARVPEDAFAADRQAATAAAAKAVDAAADTWCGGPYRVGEGEDAWVRLALRGRDPFFDHDAGALQHFIELSSRIFEAVTTTGTGGGA